MAKARVSQAVQRAISIWLVLAALAAVARAAYSAAIGGVLSIGASMEVVIGGCLVGLEVTQRTKASDNENALTRWSTESAAR